MILAIRNCIRPLHNSSAVRIRIEVNKLQEKHLPPMKPKKEIFMDSFHQQNIAKSKARREDLLSSNPDPFSPLKAGVKAVVYGFTAATILCVSYAAYDPGYRTTMRNTYPLGTFILDLVKDKEEEIVLEKKDTQHQASIFKEDLMKGVKN